jgi:hypothetical protein
LELRHSGNQSELLYVFGDKEHSYYYLLRYLMTREGEFSQSELKGVIKEIERTADFQRNKLTGILERLQGIIDSNPTLKKIMQLHVRTEKRRLIARVETTVRPELLYSIHFDEVHVFSTPEIINSGEPGARIDRQEKAQALTAALSLLEQVKLYPDRYPQFTEGWVPVTDLQAHVKSRDLTWNIENILRTYRQTVSAGARSLLEMKKISTVPYYRINPLFTDLGHRKFWQDTPDFQKVALQPTAE